jgi:hypothetical protein
MLRWAQLHGDWIVAGGEWITAIRAVQGITSSCSTLLGNTCGGDR